MDLKRIEAIIEVVKDAHVTELSIKGDGSNVVVRKSPRACVQLVLAPQTVAQEAPKSSIAGQTAEVETKTGTVVSAPMVGIFHAVDGLGAPGSLVKKGQVVGAIESMKLMNEVVADADGVVAEVFVDDGMPVEYGQVLFRLDEV